MAKTLHRLTTKTVENAKSKSLNDGGGLYYRPTSKGAGRWTLKFTSSDPKYVAAQTAKGSKLRQREMGLGSFPATSLSLAREKAADARTMVARGLDPIVEAKHADTEAERVALEQSADAERTAMTFGRYADEMFLPEVLDRYSNAAHIQQWKATFGVHAKSLTSKVLSDITREDVLAVLKPIWTTKNVTASRSRGRIERLFSHAIQNGHFHRDNPAAWRQFDATLAQPSKLTRGHHAALHHDDIAAFLSAIRLKQDDSLTAVMLEWIALSACRSGEARFAVWSEIDLERMVWAIPAGRMKMRRDHVVPITPRMAELLELAKLHRPDDRLIDDFVFARPNGSALSEMAALMMVRKMPDYKGYTVHGLRATFKGWAAEATEFARELIEEQLAHQLGAVERAYMRGSAVERRRTMMEDWAKHCGAGSQAGGNVVPIHQPTEKSA